MREQTRCAERPSEPQANDLDALICGSAISAEKAGIFIAIHQTKKLRQRIDFRIWIVPMPLEISSLPIHFPDPLRFHVGSLRYWLFYSLLGIVPKRTNLEYLDALIFDPKPEIKLGTNVRRRAPLFDERPDFFLDLFRFEFA